MHADLRLYRKEGSRQRRRRVRRELKQCVQFLREKPRKKGEWTKRDEFHLKVSNEMPSDRELQGLTSDEIVAKAITGPLRKVFDEMAPTFEDPGPMGFKPRCQKSLEKALTELGQARGDFCAAGAREGTVEHQKYVLNKEKARAGGRR